MWVTYVSILIKLFCWQGDNIMEVVLENLIKGQNLEDKEYIYITTNL
ncbi:hypothetical protein CLC_3346 [Clostridium botulinum A str. Hall]|nr:hypothetical protein CLC_3346 [Clostridium botulinum A str. Hall]